MAGEKPPQASRAHRQILMVFNELRPTYLPLVCCACLDVFSHFREKAGDRAKKSNCLRRNAQRFLSTQMTQLGDEAPCLIYLSAGSRSVYQAVEGAASRDSLLLKTLLLARGPFAVCRDSAIPSHSSSTKKTAQITCKPAPTLSFVLFSKNIWSPVCSYME